MREHAFCLNSYDPEDGTIDFEVLLDGTSLFRAMATLIEPQPSLGGIVELKDFMIYGKGSGSLGAPVIRRIAREFLNAFGFDELLVEGTRRASGAGVGRYPKPLRFR